MGGKKEEEKKKETHRKQQPTGIFLEPRAANMACSRRTSPLYDPAGPLSANREPGSLSTRPGSAQACSLLAPPLDEFPFEADVTCRPKRSSQQSFTLNSECIVVPAPHSWLRPQQLHLKSHPSASTWSSHLPSGAVLQGTSSHFHQPHRPQPLGHITRSFRPPLLQTPSTTQLFEFLQCSTRMLKTNHIPLFASLQRQSIGFRFKD